MTFLRTSTNCRALYRQFLFLGICLAAAASAQAGDPDRKPDEGPIDTALARKPNYKYIELRTVSSLIKKGEGFMYFYEFRKKNPTERQPMWVTSYDREERRYPADSFYHEVQGILERHGYVDTVHANFPSTSTTVYLEADITSRYFHRVSAPKNSGFNGREQWRANVKVVWKLVDADGKVLNTFDFAGTSGMQEMPAISGAETKAREWELQKQLTRMAFINSLVNLEKQPDVLRHLVRTAKDDSTIVAQNQPIVLDKPVIAPENQKMREFVKSGVTVVTKKGHGSGFFLNRDGYIVTNFHVVENSLYDVNVLLNSGDKVKASVLRYNTKHDVALLKVDVKDQVPLPMSTEEPEIGTEVWAIGTPRSVELGQTVSKGILSGIRRKEKEGTFLQTDVAVNSGNSGGALITADGQVRGVVTFKARFAQGLNFAIPTATVLKELKLEYRPGQQIQVPPVVAAPESVPNAEPIKLPVSAPATAPAKPAKPKK